jgi:hypothetical protein
MSTVALAIEYDVTPEGVIEVVGLINAVEEDGSDPDGAAWLAWQRAHEDGGCGAWAAPALTIVNHHMRARSAQPAPTAHGECMPGSDGRAPFVDGE